MRIALICAALVVSGVTPAVAAEPVQPQASLQASKCAVPQLIAHRGGGGVGKDPYYLENSWPAFQKSVGLGVKVLETDVRWTKDNVPVIMHDAQLSRTTNGSGLVQDVDIAYIDSLQLKNGAGAIPHFEALLQFAKENNVQLWPEYKPEIENQVWINDYAAKIKASGADVVVPSFLKPELAQFKTLLPGFPQIWFQDPLSGLVVKPSDVPQGAYAGLINVVLSNDPSIATEMRKAGITLYAWYNLVTKGDDPAGWDAMAKLKPKGIITDYPAEYQKWADSTTYCQTPKKQKAKCAKLPKKLPGDATVVLLKKTCKTNAGKKVTVKVTGKGKAVKGKNGRVSVRTRASGKVKITYKAKKTPKYTAFKKAKSYRLK
ncbi:MAG: glycerophosphodiester phosphodiesterase family protein [Candidatus Nanopelagicales bacterium]